MVTVFNFQETASAKIQGRKNPFLSLQEELDEIFFGFEHWFEMLNSHEDRECKSHALPIPNILENEKY